MNKLFKIASLLLLVFTVQWSFSQGASLSPYDLKESYLEKRATYESSSTKAISAENQAELDRILAVLEENAPNSYEYHLIKYINGNFNTDLKTHLFKAYELKPDEKEVLIELFGYYSLIDDKASQKLFASKIKRYYSKNVLAYYQFLLDFHAKPFIVFSGEADAYPALILKAEGKIPSGTEIINLDFLQNDAYRRNLQTKVGGVNLKFYQNESAFISALLKANSHKIGVSSTVGQGYLSKVASDIYLVGLTYEYQVGDQLKALNKFWSTAQNYLTQLSLDNRTEKAVHRNFLPPLLTLYKLKCANKEKDLKLRKTIELLGKETGKEAVVSELLNTYEQSE